MKKIGSFPRTILWLFLLFAPVSALGACHVVTATGSGSKNGSDWSNAYQGLPASLTRGDTYYVADGTYGAYTFNTPTSGTTLITVKKAVPSEHCTDTGWSASTMGSGTATFSDPGTVLNFTTSYITIDGMTGTGKGAHGIHLVSQSKTDGVGAITVGANGAFLTFRHIEAENAPALNSNGSRVYMSVSLTSSNNTFQYVYFHGGRVWIGFTAGGGGTANTLVEYSYFANAGSGDPSLHSAGFTVADMTNFTLRYSVIENMLGGSNTTYIEPQFSSNGVYIYGNTFWATSSNESTGQGVLAITSTDTAVNVKFYNNTIVGLHTYSGLWCGNVSGSTVWIDNNVWQNNAVAPGFQNCSNVGTHNVLNTGGVSFVNEAGGNFHLTSDTTPGATLASPFNLDPDGTTRGSDGVWDLGAYQLGSTGVVVNPPTGLTAVAN